MKKTIIIYVICSLMLLVLSPVSASNYLNKLSPEIKEIIYNNRIPGGNSHKGYYNEKIAYSFNNYDNELSPSQLKYNNNNPLFPFITVEKAISDINFLFKAMKYGYAGYQLFGGDKKFKKVQERTIVEIQKKRNYFSIITLDELKNIIYNNLNFIEDAHFLIGDRDLFDPHTYYLNNKYIFSKEGERYFTINEGEKEYLVRIGNEKPEKYIKLSLNKNGKIIYKLGKVVMDKENFLKNQVIYLESDKGMRKASINFKKFNYSGISKHTPYEYYEKDKISIIKTNSWFSKRENTKRLQQFVREAKELKNKKYLILDLRGNYGGDSKYALNWVNNFINNTDITFNRGYYMLATDTAKKLIINNMMYRGYDPTVISTFKRKLKKRNNYKGYYVKYPEVQKVNNDNLIVVLMDGDNASAVENFILLLHQFQNVVFIGHSTAGAFTTGGQGLFRLPNSNIKIFFGTRLNIPPDFVFREGKGIEPDFWVNPENALEIAVKFIDNYFK